MSSGIFPEKFAMYLSTMNSLSAKIYSDIQAVEEAVKFPANLSYSEKCAILDKHLIHDVVNNKKSVRGNLDRNMTLRSDMKTEPVIYDDPILDQDQVSALLLSVYPKTAEKYIYDDNGFWVDEHSVAYSCCTQSQAKVCKLGDFVKALPPPLITNSRKSKGNPPAYITENNKSNYKSKLSAESESQSELESDFDSCPETDQENDVPLTKQIRMDNSSAQMKPLVKKAFMGVPVMGFMGSAGPPKKEKSVENANTTNENNLPQQKQNLDLIAELQAKLKLNKAKGAAPNIPKLPQTQKVSKPKAPPPPPPKVPIPGMAVKVTAPSVPTVTVKSESKQNVEKAKSKSQKDVKASTSAKKGTEDTSKSQNEKSPEEFVVDVSSPCRIVTPKTGFDFLDNW